MKISPDGKTVWVGTTMATYDGTAWKLLAKDNFPAPDYAQRPVLMAFDRNNVSWSATYAGLVRYDGKEWKLYSPQNSPLPHQQVTALNVDMQGVVWMGTYGGHMARFDGTRWEVFKKDEKSPIGLTENFSPKSIKFDMDGTMYFTYYNIGKVSKHIFGAFKKVSYPNVGG